MTVFEDRRDDNRLCCKIPIVVSPFNSKDSMVALLVDYGTNGIGFISNDALLMGTAIVFKIAYGAVKDFHGEDLLQLPSIRLGEVKWCRKHPDDTSKAYKIGIKYYFQDYQA
jgi:hypothetical protein